MATNRPTDLKDFVGQDNLKPLIQGIIETCNKTHKPWPHTLCFGPPGVGKTTLSQCVNSGLDGYTFISLTASRDWTPDTLRRILLDLPIEGYSKVTNNGAWIPGAPKYMVFIDEIGELKNDVWVSVMLNCMEDGELHIGAATSWLPELSIFASTTDPYRIPSAGLSRFGLQLHLQPYVTSDLEKIIGRIYPKMSDDLKREVAQRSRGIARLALSFAEGVNNHGLSFFDILGVDSEGLNELDRKYISALEGAKGASMALGTIANIVCENAKTLQTFVEPELQRLGMLEINAHGRSLKSTGRGPKARD